MATFLITGANRGIGLALTKHAIAHNHIVIGTARDPDAASELKDTGARAEALDVTDDASCAALAQRIGDEPIDILINNAGIFDHSADALADLNPDAFTRTLETNTLGPILVTRALTRNIAASSRKLVVHISSDLGSMDSAVKRGGGYLAYATSKAALNMAHLSITNELNDHGITSVAIHPGWVQTDMGGQEAPMTPDQSAESILATLGTINASHAGAFLRHDGTPMNW